MFSVNMEEGSVNIFKELKNANTCNLCKMSCTYTPICC